MNVVLNVLKLTEIMLKYKYLIFFHQVSFFVRPRIFGAYLVNYKRDHGFWPAKSNLLLDRYNVRKNRVEFDKKKFYRRKASGYIVT